MDEFHLELTRLHRLPRLHRNELGGVEKAVLLQLQLNKPRRKACAVDREIDLLENVGDGADVILVSVGDEETAEAVMVLHQVAHIGNDAVDTVHIVAGESHTAVHHDDLAAILIHGHILADLVKTAKRDDFQFFCHDLLLFQCKNGRILAHWGEKWIAKQRRSA